MWGMIATWRMALEGIQKVTPSLSKEGVAGDAIEGAIKEVEDFPYFKSVGYGGLPNEKMEVELDAAYLDGSRFDFGAVCAIKNFANPISIARELSHYKVNNVLVGQGAQEFARSRHFEEKEMLTDRAKIHYHNRLKDLEKEQLSPYAGHDTVGMVALDTHGDMVAGTSTSGLFMKKPGRVGDSAFIGSGLYVDSTIGGATATGLGENLMKGVISYEIVRLMKEGLSPQKACEKAVKELDARLKRTRGEAGDISVVAMNRNGDFGAATNIDNFSFVVATKSLAPTVFRVHPQPDGTMSHELASKEWLESYLEERMKPLEVKE